MVGRCAHDGQAQGDIHATRKIQSLNGDQGLIMVHAQGRIIAGARLCVKHRVGGLRPSYGHSGALQLGNPGGNLVYVLPANLTAFAGMGIEPGNTDARFFYAKVTAQSVI